MPFTPAHAAIVLPFIKSRYTSATGLIVGSLTPDFEYFLKMSVDSNYSHTFPGLFYFDLPIAVALAFIFHGVVKKNLISNLPACIQQRLQLLNELNFKSYFKKNYLIFITSALLGETSHILWDGFTHGDGYFVNQLSFYDGTNVFLGGARYPLWYVLQHVSTFAGLAVVFIYLFMMKRNLSKTSKPSVLYWLVVLIIMIMVICIRFSFSAYDVALGNFVISTISACCLAFVVTGLIPFHTKSFVE